MSNNDTYAADTVAREKAYRAAFQSDEFRRWVDSLSPEQRRLADEKGLLVPMLDSLPADTKVDDLPANLQPTCELGAVDPDEAVHEAFLRRLGLTDDAAAAPGIRDTRLSILRAYFAKPCRNPELRRRCFAFLLGQGSGAYHASKLGMSRQRFDYHALRIQRELALPDMGNLHRS